MNVHDELQSVYALRDEAVRELYAALCGHDAWMLASAPALTERGAATEWFGIMDRAERTARTRASGTSAVLAVYVLRGAMFAVLDNLIQDRLGWPEVRVRRAVDADAEEPPAPSRRSA